MRHESYIMIGLKASTPGAGAQAEYLVTYVSSLKLGPLGLAIEAGPGRMGRVVSSQRY